MNSTPARETPTAAPQGEGEISLLEFLIVLARHKWLILGLPLLAAIIGWIVSLQITPKYTATARLLPPQQAQSAAGGLLGQLGALVGGGGVGAGGGTADPFVAMLKSRTMADALIERFGLIKAYNTSLAGARGRVMSSSRFGYTREGLLEVTVEDPDPKLATMVANAYGEELEKLTAVMAVTEASRRRLFFERQLAQTKDNLLKAEMATQAAFERGGLASVDTHSNTIISAIASLRARITAKELEMSMMRGVITEQNPQYQKAQMELGALRDQLFKLERGEASKPIKPASEQGLKNTVLLRELKYQDTLFDILARQYEAAKMDESKEGAVIQMLDKALEPEWPSSPNRRIILAASALGAFLLAVVLTVILEGFERARRDPQSRQRLAELASHFRLRRR